MSKFTCSKTTGLIPCISTSFESFNLQNINRLKTWRLCPCIRILIVRSAKKIFYQKSLSSYEQIMLDNYGLNFFPQSKIFNSQKLNQKQTGSIVPVNVILKARIS